MNNEELKFDIYQPFGPSILKTKLPQAYVDALNQQSDKILNDEKLSKEHDWSHNLAGNVKRDCYRSHGDQRFSRIPRSNVRGIL